MDIMCISPWQNYSVVWYDVTVWKSIKIQSERHHSRWQISFLPCRNPLWLLAQALLPPRTPHHSRPWISQTPGQPADPQLTPKRRCSGSGWWRAARPLNSAGAGSSSGHDRRWLLAAQNRRERRWSTSLLYAHVKYLPVSKFLQYCRFCWCPLSCYCVLNTLDTVTGFRQVCPPPEKLQETSIVSDEQPRLGSIQ